MSASRAAQLLEYYPARDLFLADHPLCEPKVHPRCAVKSKDVHHSRGRSGKWLLKQEYWMATCRPCHDWIRDHTAEAKALGLIGPWMREGAGLKGANA